MLILSKITLPNSKASSLLSICCYMESKIWLCPFQKCTILKGSNSKSELLFLKISWLRMSSILIVLVNSLLPKWWWWEWAHKETLFINWLPNIITEKLLKKNKTFYFRCWEFLIPMEMLTLFSQKLWEPLILNFNHNFTKDLIGILIPPKLYIEGNKPFRLLLFRARLVSIVLCRN